MPRFSCESQREPVKATVDARPLQALVEQRHQVLVFVPKYACARVSLSQFPVVTPPPIGFNPDQGGGHDKAKIVSGIALEGAARITWKDARQNSEPVDVFAVVMAEQVGNESLYRFNERFRRVGHSEREATP